MHARTHLCYNYNIIIFIIIYNNFYFAKIHKPNHIIKIKKFLFNYITCVTSNDYTVVSR